jgi:hypothetical protein
MGCSPYHPVYGSTVAAGNTAAVMSLSVVLAMMAGAGIIVIR